jgi:NAD(P)-dependent dehydrogenase (short-subunit alcohol dehydrogenase family)
MTRTTTGSPLNGRTVLVTGAAGGIGAATAQLMAERGATLVLVDVDAHGLEQTVKEIGDDRAIGVVGDVTDLASLEAAVAQGVERFGGLDGVLANAGIGSFGSVLGVDPEAFKRVIDVNLTGVFHTVRAALPAVIERQGYVLVVSSLAAFAAAPGMASYDASKAGAEHFANSLSLEMKPHGVAVGSAHMSWIETPMVQEARQDLPTFGEMIDKLPPPLNRTTDVQTCARAFVEAFEKRSRRVYVPGWVGVLGRLRMLLTTAAGERLAGGGKDAGDALKAMDEQVRRLGRSVSERYTR